MKKQHRQTAHPASSRGTSRAVILPRFIGRAVSLCMVIATAAVDYFVHVFSARRGDRTRLRLAWMQRSSGNFLSALNVHIASAGAPPHRGLMVCNHLGYLDILVLGTVCPGIFVSKSEVRSWPVFGWFATLAGTLFVDRTRRLDVERVNREIKQALGSGVPVILFPEGTSTNGRQVLPFRSSLLDAAAASGWPSTPACLSYEVPGGSAERDACYWGDMDFLQHLMKLMTRETVNASVIFGSVVKPCADRKVLASTLHGEVAALQQKIPGKPRVTGEALEDLAR